MRWRHVILGLSLLAWPLAASGVTRYVSHWGSHTAPYSTWETAATNLAAAMGAATNGETIWVTNGVYRSGSAVAGGLPARVRLTRSISLRSVNGFHYTVIEGAAHSEETPLGTSAVRCVYMTNGVLDGFTLRRGCTADSGVESAMSGGGLYAGGGTQRNLRVVGNTGKTAAGGWFGRSVVSNGTFDLNTSESGPAVKIDRRVRFVATRISTQRLPVPNLSIVGTNGEPIVNGDSSMEAGNGAWFGGVHVGTGVTTHVFTLSNAGDGPLEISRVSKQGGDSEEFELVTAPSNAVLNPGDTTELEIRFDPREKGVRSTLFFVENNDPDDDPYALWLGGDGLQSEMRVLGTNKAWIANGSTNPTLATGADFGIYGNAPVRRRFAVTNAGSFLLTLTGTPQVVIAGEHTNDFRVVQQPVDSLEPGEVVEFEIEFFPHRVNTRTAVVQIGSDDTYHTNGWYQFAIQGTCPATNPFINAQANLLGKAGSSMAWGDVDNDGLMDLAILGTDGTNRFTEIHRNLGNGVFTNMQAGLIGLESGNMAFGDCDNDGWLDLAVSGMSGTGAVTKIFRNQQDGSFVEVNTSLAGTISGGLAWGDYDNDGDLDLAVSGFNGSVGVGRLYRNDGNRRFTSVNFNLPLLQNGQLAWVDMDKSGWLALVMTGDTGTGKTSRLYRNIDGVLTNYSLVGVNGSAYGGLDFGDLNNDGWPDLALTGYGTNGMVGEAYRFTGTPTLFTHTISLAPLWLGNCEWGDLDNNGWQDLVISGENESNKRFVNVYTNRNGALGQQPTQIPGLRISSVAMADADLDGDLDLAVSGMATNGYTSEVYRNLSTVSNAPPGAPSGLTATLTNGNEVIFRWNAATDDFTPAASLTYNLYVGVASNPVAVMSPHADMSTGHRQIVGTGNAQYRREWRLRNLPAGTQLVWGVQAIDGAHEGGAFAAGTPIETEALPDLVVSRIQVMNVPFQATVTISNRGTAASTAPVKLSGWINHSAAASCGEASDLTNTVGILGVGEATNVVFANIPQLTNVVVYTFRAYVNSVCQPSMWEIRLDNNQLGRVYTNRVYEAFWFQATALTNDVYLRWINPTNIGMGSSEVLLHASDSAYPATTNDGSQIYRGTNQVFHHTDLTPGQPSYYTIWVTHDGTNWFSPPE